MATLLLSESPGRRLGRIRPDVKPAARSRRREARAALVVGLVASIAAMLGLSTALETKHPEWRDPEYGHRLLRLREIQMADPERPLVLVLGTSRTQNAVDPSAMAMGEDAPRVFNFGQSGASPLSVMLTLERLWDDGIRPASVLVEVLPVWLTPDGPAEDQFREAAARLTRRDIERLAPFCDRPATLWRYWLQARFAPWHAQRISLVSHWLPQWLPWQSRIAFQWQTMTPDGFVPFLYSDPPPSFRVSATAEAHAQYEHAFHGIRPSEISLRALRLLIERCRENGVGVAFFTPPVAPTFRSWFLTSADCGVRNAELLTPHAMVLHVPHSEDYRDEDFADGHHLLRGAAARYSRELGKEIRTWLCQPGFRGVRP